jgi:hypothetical protein
MISRKQIRRIHRRKRAVKWLNVNAAGISRRLQQHIEKAATLKNGKTTKPRNAVKLLHFDLDKTHVSKYNSRNHNNN